MSYATNTCIVLIPGLGDTGGKKLYYEFYKSIEKRPGINFMLYNSPKSINSWFEVNDFKKLARVIKKLKSQYSKIYLIGHSLGCLSAIRLSNRVDGTICWDPSLHPYDVFKFMNTSLKTKNKAKRYPQIKKLLNEVKTPITIISAEKAGGVFVKSLYMAHATNFIKNITIKSSDHDFSAMKHRLKLFKYTLDSIKNTSPKDW